MDASRRGLSVLRLMGCVAIVGVLIPVGLIREKGWRSCHLCHNRKSSEATSIFGMPIRWSDTGGTDFPTAPGHVHRWVRYSRASEGCLIGKSVACRARVYNDGGAGPDGMR